MLDMSVAERGYLRLELLLGPICTNTLNNSLSVTNVEYFRHNN